MRVRFEVDVESSAARSFACRLQRDDLRVLHARVRVSSGSGNDTLRIRNHRADVWIRRGETYSFARKVERTAEQLLVSDVTHLERIYHGATETRRQELLFSARRETTERIIFDLSHSRPAAAFRAATQWSGDIGVRISGRRGFHTQQTFQQIDE
jgi:hypothetical protein